MTLAHDWKVWAAENLLAGSRREEVAAALVEKGVDIEEAAAQVAAIAASPAFVAAARFVVHGRRLELTTRLLSSLSRTATRATEIERCEGLGADTFFDRYYATNTPVVLTDVVTRWPAFTKWTPQYIQSRVGDVEVAVTTEREADPDYDMRTAAHTRTMTLRSFIDRVLAAGESNDLYMVAQNRNIDRPELQVLYDDVTWDPGMLDPARRRGSAALWIGPAGTVTPLHHDTSNIVFGQVYGRKRFHLIAPWETALHASLRGVYSRIDPERPDLDAWPDFAHVLVKTVTLEPGEMLFIPVGWWHHVRALSVNINLAFTNFTRNNAYDWFRPGEVRPPLRL